MKNTKRDLEKRGQALYLQMMEIVTKRMNGAEEKVRRRFQLDLEDLVTAARGYERASIRIELEASGIVEDRAR